MEPQYEPGLAAALWESALVSPPSIKFDNRAYLVAAYTEWTHMTNRRLTKTAPVEEQIVPDAYAAGYRAPMG